MSKQHRIYNIAYIITGEYFDAVALQEVSRADALTELCSILPGNWKYAYSDPPAETFARAYIWNADRLRLLKEPSLLTNYHVDNGNVRLKRAPYCARFTADGLGGPAIEIKLINVHLEPTIEKITTLEYQTLAEKIYPDTCHYIDIDDEYYMPAYTISLGDYNLRSKKCRKVIKNDQFVTVQEMPTTLSNKYPRYTANDFDHFSYDRSDLEGFGICVERVDAVRKYFDNDYRFYHECVSDHIPIKFSLTF